MILASSLHKARLVCFLQQLLGKGHEPRMFHQPPPLRHLSGQRLASLLPGPLQGLGEGSVALGQGGRQIPNALSQLLSGGHTVHLVMSNTDGQVQASSKTSSQLMLTDNRLPLSRADSFEASFFFFCEVYQKGQC